jgi:hypothetical protein
LLLGFASTIIPSFSLLEMNVVRNGGLLFDKGGTDLSVQALRFLYLIQHEYIRCHGVQVTLCTLCRCAFLSVQAYAAGCALTYYSETEFSQLNGLRPDLPQARIIPLHGFSLSITTFIWFFVV